MFHLPNEILRKIYEYDPTYYDIHNVVLLDMMNDKRLLLRKFCREDVGWLAYQPNENHIVRITDLGDEHFEVEFATGLQETFIVLYDSDLDDKVGEWIENNLDQLADSVLADFTGLQVETVEIMRTEIWCEDFKSIIDRLLKDQKSEVVQECLNEIGAETFIDSVWKDVYQQYYDFDSDHHFLLLSV